MKIQVVKKAEKTFGELKPGDVFKFSDAPTAAPFMKMAAPSLSVNLVTGEATDVPDTRVIPINAVLMVNS